MPYEDQWNKVTCTSGALPTSTSSSGYVGGYLPANISYSAGVSSSNSQSSGPHSAPVVPFQITCPTQWNQLSGVGLKAPASEDVQSLTHTGQTSMLRIPPHYAHYQDPATCTGTFSHPQQHNFNGECSLPARQKSSSMPQPCVPNWGSLQQYMPINNGQQSAQATVMNSKNMGVMCFPEGRVIPGFPQDPRGTTLRTKCEGPVADPPGSVGAPGTREAEVSVKSPTYFAPSGDEGVLSSNFNSPGGQLDCLSSVQSNGKEVPQISKTPFPTYAKKPMGWHHLRHSELPYPRVNSLTSASNPPSDSLEMMHGKLPNVHLIGCQSNLPLSVEGNGPLFSQPLPPAISGEPMSEAERLKRPMNGYLLFNKEMRHRLLEYNPNLTVAEISREIGRQWKHLTEEERTQYIDRAKLLKSEFLKNHPDYVYSRRSKAEMLAAGLKVRGKRKSCFDMGSSDETLLSGKDPRGRKKKSLKNPAAPKHPMSGYLFYLAMRRPMVMKERPGTSVGVVSKIAAEEWKVMAPSEREPWERKAANDKARYAKEMEVYNAEALTPASVGTDSQSASTPYDPELSTVPAAVGYSQSTPVCMPIESLVQPRETTNKNDESSDPVFFPGYNYIS